MDDPDALQPEATMGGNPGCARSSTTDTKAIIVQITTDAQSVMARRIAISKICALSS